MPELVPLYARLIELAGGDDLSARFLSLYGPGPFLTGCSQACLSGAHPLLVRNYDYDPDLWDAVFMRTAWNGRTVLAMIDCAWGVLDGINEDGLAVALAFGGRRVVGDGFGAPIILRYVLETCSSVEDGIECLRRVPSHMAYNITLLDGSGTAKTVHIAPDRATQVLDRPYSANHQNGIDWPEYERATHSVERQSRLAELLKSPGIGESDLVSAFLAPPLHTAGFATGWGTLYTAVYDATKLQARLKWPEMSVEQSVADFTETTLDVPFGAATGAT